jgi:DNA-binding LacI/PurR family transcriptional regulator
VSNQDPKKRKVRLQEISNLAQVSVATVSRVLNGNTRVDPSLQKAVLDAAGKLDIDISRRNKTRTLAFLLNNRAMLHAFHSRILIGAEAHCASHGWDMVFLSFNYSPNVSWKELHPPKVMQRHDVVRAVILAGTNSMNLLDFLKRKGIDFAVLGNNVLDGQDRLQSFDTVFCDDTQGGYDMTRYIIGLGHRKIGFVGNIRLPWFARYFAGYRRAMDEAGLKHLLSSTDSEDDPEIGYIGAKSLLAQHNSITAIFAGNDPTAHGVYKALRDKGLRIPEDITVSGANDTIGAWLHPSLTSSREFPEQLGKQLVELVLNRIAKPNLEPQHVIIPTELVKRDSCAPVRASEENLHKVLVRNV